MSEAKKSPVKIQTSGQFMEAYCKAYNLHLDSDTEKLNLIQTKAHGCRVCGRKPRLYADIYPTERLQTNGATWRRDIIGAGVLMCGCGKSSMFYDEREAVERMDPQALLEPIPFLNRLIDSWNA